MDTVIDLRLECREPLQELLEGTETVPVVEVILEIIERVLHFSLGPRMADE